MGQPADVADRGPAPALGWGPDVRKARGGEKYDPRKEAALRDALIEVSDDLQHELWEDLTKYALGVMTAWIVTGEVAVKARQRRIPGVSALPPHWSHADRESLADEVVAVGLVAFLQEGLIGGGWRPEGGASLRTYLVNRCIIAFRDLSQRAETRIEPSPDISVDDDEQGFVDKPARRSVEDIAITNVIRDVILRAATRVERVAMMMHVAGYSYEEICAATGLKTRRAVEGRLYRLKQKVRQMFPEWAPVETEKDERDRRSGQ